MDQQPGEKKRRRRTAARDGDDDDELAGLHLLEAEEDRHAEHGDLERGRCRSVSSLEAREREKGGKRGRTEVNALSLRGRPQRVSQARECARQGAERRNAHLDEGHREREVGKVVEDERPGEEGPDGDDLSGARADAASAAARRRLHRKEDEPTHVLEPPVPAHLHVLHVVEHVRELAQEAGADGRVDQVPAGRRTASAQSFAPRKEAPLHVLRGREQGTDQVVRAMG